MTKKKAIYVPVGEYRVTQDSLVELWTVTASCVALILTDTVHHVIGALHVVLPGRRTDLREDDRHAYFADTGVPLLLNEMEKAGADKNCLSAILVGGGSLFQWQEGVDIGRENVTALKTSLNRYAIPVIREDTGGAEGRRVSISTGVHSLLIEQIKYSRSETKEPQSETGTSTDNLTPFIDELEKIPVDKALKEALLSEVHAREIDQVTVCNILSRDPMLALYFFRLLNSPYYGVKEPVTSFEKAQKILAKPHFRRLCIVTSFAGNNEEKASLPAETIRNWKHHSIATAFIARHLAETILPDKKEEAYLTGLIHSIGDLCLALENPERAIQGFHAKNNESPMTGMILSSELLNFWNYPKIFSETVSSDTFSEISHLEEKNILPAILHVACWLSRLIGITADVETDNFILNRPLVKKLGLSDSIHTLLPPIITGLESLGLKEWIKN